MNSENKTSEKKTISIKVKVMNSMLKPDAKMTQLLTKTTANTLPSIGTKPY